MGKVEGVREKAVLRVKKAKLLNKDCSTHFSVKNLVKDLYYAQNWQ